MLRQKAQTPFNCNGDRDIKVKLKVPVETRKRRAHLLQAVERSKVGLLTLYSLIKSATKLRDEVLLCEMK